MEKNISERKRKENEIRNAIIYQSLRNNIICLNDNLNNNIHFSLKTKFQNASNIIKFNLLHRCLKTKYPEKTKVKIYDKEYDLTNDIDKKEFELYFKNIIYCSYRNNYPTQKNYKNNIEYNSDCGWGCMIRSSQMILAKAIYEILIHEKNDNVSSIFNTISLLLEYPFNYNETPNIYTKYKLKVEEFLNQKNENNKNIKVNNIYNENNNNNQFEIKESSNKEFYNNKKEKYNYNFSNYYFNDYIDTVFKKDQIKKISDEPGYFYPLNLYNKNNQKWFSASNNIFVRNKKPFLNLNTINYNNYIKTINDNSKGLIIKPNINVLSSNRVNNKKRIYSAF